MRRVSVALGGSCLVLLLAGLALTAIWAPGRSQAATRPSATLVGDSLTVGVKPYLPEDLHGWRLEVDARVGRPLAEGLSHLERLRRDGQLGQVVAVGLGTNDDPRRTAAFADDVRTVLRLTGQRCVVWANVYRPPVAGVSYDGYDRVLARLDRAYRRLRVLDWAAMARRHPEWFSADSVHPSAAGYQARAAALARLLRRCPR